jgi:hypothetical protein
MAPPRLASLLFALPPLAACTVHTTRIVCRPEPAYVLRPAPPPAPQVVLATPPAPATGQRPVSTLTEEQRTELLRAAGSPIPPYTPAPIAPSVRRWVVEREVVRVPYARYHVHGPCCSPGCTLGRVAAYTGIGAIVGHQFHERGAGAAIGAGLAFLTTPWWWGHGVYCWD